tara:strand:+ start:309 stop:509 length:201 start_codon:yes stop_codon:yes gene_type:complete
MIEEKIFALMMLSISQTLVNLHIPLYSLKILKEIIFIVIIKIRFLNEKRLSKTAGTIKSNLNSTDK